jgi:hypothetical protein
MKSSVVQAIQHVKIAEEFMNDFIRSAPTTRGAIIFGQYSRKLRWILSDIITYPHFDDEVRKGIKVEIESDAFSVGAIKDLIPLLNPEQREMIEDLIEDILKGKTIEVSIKDHIVEPNEMIEKKEETWECYEINVVQARMYGCNSQCQQCREKQSKTQ